MNSELIITKDGSHTLYIKELDEYYHSHFGAIAESRHVFIEAGLKAVNKNKISIFEMGFGTGLNAFLTLAENMGTGKTIHYSCIEKYPLDKKTYLSLNYSSHCPDIDREYFIRLHESSWSEDSIISDDFILNKTRADISDFDFQRQFDLVYFDAFGPDKQPELWTTEIFSKIYRNMRTGAILTTYSSKGQIRRNMGKAGFRFEKLEGPPGKWDMTRAWKD